MPTHSVGTREDWLDARLALLQAEKELTRQSDAVARQRQALPWVPVRKEYRFDTDDGSVSLRDLFEGRSQLLVYHFMFGPDYTAGCPSCSSIADGFNGVVVHLENHDVAFWAVSSAPLPKLNAFKRRMGWTFAWASAGESDFNADFAVTFTEKEQREGIRYNYRAEPPVAREDAEPTEPAIPTRTTPTVPASNAEMSGTDPVAYARQRPGTSAFALEDGVVYHTYSTYARGVDSLWAVYQWLDRAPLGRNESGVWLRYRDAYGR